MTPHLPFLLGYISLLLALAAFGWLHYTRKRNEALELRLDQRTADLERLTTELLDANRVKQDFLANMSHEIRNPLNGILGIARHMREDSASSEQPSELVAHLYSCSQQLHQLLSQTLDYSSLEVGKLSLRPKAFSPTQIINEVVRMHQPLIDEKKLELRLDLPSETPTWMGDRVLLRQILINLISNAVKYTPKGFVSIRLSDETNGSEVNACFEVSDSGPGIPKDKQDYIFEKFTRLAKAAESSISGAGLGLAVAAEMATLMQGALKLNTQATSGACFVLTLPFTINDECSASVSNDAEGQALFGRHVLIADDMDFNRYINKVILQKMGATVHEATDGIGAQLALETMYFDIAILDINMPGLSGIEVVQKILAHDTPLQPVFVALSAHATPEMQAACLVAGFAHFIKKPLDQKKLESLIDQPIESPPPARSALDNSLLNYLAENDPSAVAALENRYRASLIEEVESLQQSIKSYDQYAQGQTIHKLKGLTSFKKDTALLDLLNLMKQYLEVDAPIKRRLSLCEQMKAHIEQS
jgi:signal transduction histidine kinase/DNA-binding NarL/FixJ family response regulator